jgi:isoamylase
VNYWGYNTLSYFAPDLRFASVRQPYFVLAELKHMVRTLHAAGIEVILDVVYNHTGEGGAGGPTLSFRGIDNASYYRLTAGRLRDYEDFTGCGNTLNMQHPRVLQLLMDSLRYWVLEMHVDGFRFDLASALARELLAVDQLSSFFDLLRQDPVLSQCKLIAEPWDLGPGGYQVGRFPSGWTEWNGKYRDTVRRFWRGDGHTMGELATRLTGSSDLYGNTGRKPIASINFVTCHDGFTLTDLVSYERKHNEANGEGNRDGNDQNDSWNCGAEGPTDDPAVRALRLRQRRNLLATLFFSQGVPMLLAGDELGHSQGGNNNAYCQDNETTWLKWDLGADDEGLLEFVRYVSRLRREHPSLRRRRFFHDRPLRGSGEQPIYWLHPAGAPMTDADWSQGFARCFGVVYNGDTEEVDAQGHAVEDDDLVLLFNASENDIAFHLPPGVHTLPALRVLVDTFDGAREGKDVLPRDPYPLAARSLVLLGWARVTRREATAALHRALA